MIKGIMMKTASGMAVVRALRPRSLRRRKYCGGKTYLHTVRGRIIRRDFSFWGVPTYGN